MFQLLNISRRISERKESTLSPLQTETKHRTDAEETAGG